MSFRSDINAAYDKKVLGLLDKVTRKVAFDVQADLSRSTPVDTGRARSNWLPSIGAPRRDRSDNTGGAPLINFNGYRVGMKIFLTNNLPYIRRLNEGHSKQAPAGFVDNVIQRNVNRIQAAVRYLKI